MRTLLGDVLLVGSVVLATATVACDQDDTGDESEDQGSDAEAYGYALGEKLCEYVYRCSTPEALAEFQTDTGFAGEGDCAAGFGQMNAVSFAMAADRGTVEMDEAAAQRCLDEFQDLECAIPDDSLDLATLVPESCGEVLVGLVPDGGECVVWGECAVAGSLCVDGRCVAP